MLVATLTDTQDLPDAAGGDVGEGFTCTGLTRAPDGTWWACNDGRDVFGDTSYESSLVHLSADFSTKLGEIVLDPVYTGIQSVQGIAYDTSDDTLWFADYNGQAIRHITLAGSAITGDQITGLGYSPNGLARDSDNDRLFIGRDSSTTIELRSCVNGSLIQSYTVGPSTNGSRDHFYYAGGNVLYISAGPNDTPGMIQKWVVGDASATTIYAMREADAIEGIYYVGSTLYVLNDAYFHGSISAVNRALTFTISEVSDSVAPEFYGNPNARISSVDVSGGIAVGLNSQRVTPNSPAQFHCSAKNITCVGTIVNTDETTATGHSVRAYEDLEFRWTFSDPNSTETFTNPYTGATVNAATGQIGPEATYVYFYPTPGSGNITKTVTLTIRWIVSRSGGVNTYASTTAQATLTLRDFVTIGSSGTGTTAPTIIYMSGAGNDTTGDGSEGAPYQTWEKLTDLVDGQSNLLIRLRPGDTFSGAFGALVASGTRWEAYDFGGRTLAVHGRPTISSSGSGNNTLKSLSGNGDHYFSNINFDSNIATSGGIVGTFQGTSGQMVDVYFYNCTIEEILLFLPAGGGSYLQNRQGCWRCDIVSNGGITTGYWGRTYGSIVGCNFSGAGQNSDMDHHIYTAMKSNFHVRWNTFDNDNALRLACINGNWNGESADGVDDFTEFWCISENASQGTRIFAETMGTSAPPHGVPLGRNSVWERNRIHNHNWTTSSPLLGIDKMETVTIRDNLFYSNGAVDGDARHIQCNDPEVSNDLNIYRNKVYRQGGMGGTQIFDLRTLGRVQFTDNSTWDDRLPSSDGATTHVMRTPAWAGMASAGHVWDRNNWYVPNPGYTVVIAEVDDQSKTFVEFCASSGDGGTGLDQNATFARPNWNDPANGNFNAALTVRVTLSLIA